MRSIHPGKTLRRSLPSALSILALLAAALLVLPAPPADAQGLRVGQQDRTEIINLEARVRYLGSNQVRDYPLDPAQHVQLTVGDHVQVSLVATAIVRNGRNERGVEVNIPATFEVASGSWRIDVAPAGRHQVRVIAQQPNEVHRGNPDSRSSLRYEIQGNYDMRPALRDGRVTFDIAPAEGVAQPSQPLPGNPNDERWDIAADVAEDLAHVRLETRTGSVDDYWVERIYLNGYEGVREVARALAAEAVRSGDLRRYSADEVVARLYRHLLHREGTVAQLRAEDPTGFDSNIARLRAEGYESLVRTFIDSQEFRTKHRIERMERLSRSYEEPRYRDDDRRRPLYRDVRPH